MTQQCAERTPECVAHEAFQEILDHARQVWGHVFTQIAIPALPEDPLTLPIYEDLLLLARVTIAVETHRRFSRTGGTGGAAGAGMSISECSDTYDA